MFEAQPGDVEFWVHTNGTAPTYIGGSSGAFTRVSATSVENAVKFPVRAGEKIYAARVGSSNDTVRFLVRSI